MVCSSFNSLYFSQYHASERTWLHDKNLAISRSGGAERRASFVQRENRFCGMKKVMGLVLVRVGWSATWVLYKGSEMVVVRWEHSLSWAAIWASFFRLSKFSLGYYFKEEGILEWVLETSLLIDIYLLLLLISFCFLFNVKQPHPERDSTRRFWDTNPARWIWARVWTWLWLLPEWLWVLQAQLALLLLRRVRLLWVWVWVEVRVARFRFVTFS